MLQEPEKSSVPWTFLDVALFFALWLGAQVIIGSIVLAAHSTSPSPSQESLAADSDGEGYKHPIEQLVQQSKNAPIILLVAFLSVVVVAPLIEEFIFRLLFQGWLESTLLQFHVPGASGVAVVVVSCCFAAIHAGSGSDLSVQALLSLFMAFIILNLLVFTLGIIYLVRVKNIKLTDYLFGTERFFHPNFFPCAGYCLLVILLCFGLNAALEMAYPHTNTSPIPIFFFSLALGTLYSKTKNLSYCILLHACLNGMSFAMLWLSLCG